MSSGLFPPSSSSGDREAMLKLNEAKIKLARENALLKKQLENHGQQQVVGGTPAAASATSQQQQRKNVPSTVPRGVTMNPNNVPRAASAVAAAKHEAELNALRKEVTTMKKLLAAAQTEHKRQLEAVVLEGVEHEERYRQLIVAMDAKVTARDKKIAELRAELAAAGTSTANKAAAVTNVQGRHAPSPLPSVTPAAAANPATSALLADQTRALQQILQIANAITTGSPLPVSLTPTAPKAQRKTALPSKRPREGELDEGEVSASHDHDGDKSDVARTVLAHEVISEASTLATAAHSSLPLAHPDEDGQKRRGRPPGKASLAATRRVEEKERLAATTRAVLLSSSMTTGSAGGQSSASASLIPQLTSPSSTTTGMNQTSLDFGSNPIEGYLRARKEAGAERGVEASRLATTLVSHALYRNDTDRARLADDFSAYVSSRCGQGQIASTREGTKADVLMVVEGIQAVQGLAGPFLMAAWTRAVAMMNSEACHINHSYQLFAIGYSMRCLVDRVCHSSSTSLASSLALSSSPDAPIAVIPSLCLGDILCAFLHVRNRERGQEEKSYALEQLLSFLRGLLSTQNASDDASARHPTDRSLPEMVAHVILEDVMKSNMYLGGGGGGGLGHDADKNEAVSLYHELCEHAGWSASAHSPDFTLKGLLAKLRVAAALSTSSSSSTTVTVATTVGNSSADLIQMLVLSIRPLLLFTGYSSITVLVDAFSAAVDTSAAASGSTPSPSAASASAESSAARHVFMQLLATALLDFTIVESSPDWGTFSGLFSQYLVDTSVPSSSTSATSASTRTTNSNYTTIAHLFVCEALIRAGVDAAQIANRFNSERTGGSVSKLEGLISPILSSRLAIHHKK